MVSECRYQIIFVIIVINLYLKRVKSQVIGR